MRPPATDQNPLRTPLNRIFGSEGGVRVLRVLAFAGEPLGRTGVARRARLNPSGVRRTLDRLAEVGIVEVIGSGRSPMVRLRERHPLAGEIRFLFEAERACFERFVDALGEAIAGSDLRARAVWIERSGEGASGTVGLGVLGSPDTVDAAVREVRRLLEPVEEGFGLRFAVRPRTDEERDAPSGAEAAGLGDLTLLRGWLPRAWHAAAGGPVRSRRYPPARAHEISLEIGRLLPEDPSIVDRALEWLDELLAAAEGRGREEELEEWRGILEGSSAREIREFLREESSRADRLRPALPFVEVLGPADRERVLGAATHGTSRRPLSAP